MLGGMSWMHWAVVIVLVALLFGGRGKISALMGDAAKGIRAFKAGLGDAEHADDSPSPLTGPASERKRAGADI